MPSAYWQQQTEPFNNGLRTIGAALANRPYMQAMANNRAMMGQYYQAHAGQEEASAEEARARAGLAGVQTQRGQFQLSSALALADRFKQPGAITQDSEGNLVIDKAAIGDVVSAISGESKDANDASSAIAGLLKGRNLPVQADLDRQNKTNINAATIAGKAAQPVVVPSGGTLVNPQTGKPMTEGGVTLPPGATRFAPQVAGNEPMTQTATGQPVQPKSSAVDNTIASAIAKTVLANNSTSGGGNHQHARGDWKSAFKRLVSIYPSLRCQCTDGHSHSHARNATWTAAHCLPARPP